MLFMWLKSLLAQVARSTRSAWEVAIAPACPADVCRAAPRHPGTIRPFRPRGSSLARPFEGVGFEGVESPKRAWVLLPLEVFLSRKAGERGLESSAVPHAGRDKRPKKPTPRMASY